MDSDVHLHDSTQPTDAPFDDVFPFDSIPAELRARHQWVADKLVPKADKPGKFDKVPYDPRPYAGIRKASVDDPATWGSYDHALSALLRRDDAGEYLFDCIGFVFTADDPYVGMDIDACIECGWVKSWAQAIITRCATYAERSVSGTGVHLIGRGAALPRGLARDWEDGAVELYSDGRHFVMTGKRLPGTPATITDTSAAFAEVYHMVWDADLADAVGHARRGHDAYTITDPAALACPESDLLRRVTKLFDQALAKIAAGDHRNDVAYQLGLQLGSLRLTRQEIIALLALYERAVR